MSSLRQNEDIFDSKAKSIKNIQKIKIIFWGCTLSGKTTALDTLYKITVNNNDDIFLVGKLTKIAMRSGATLYFDRVTFDFKSKNGINLHLFTVAGQTRFRPLREKVFEGADGIIFVVDSQRSSLEANVSSLKELKLIAGKKLIRDIPVVFMINKRDLEDKISVREWKSILYKEGLLFDQDHPYFLKNPAIFETVSLYHKNENIYRVFNEISRRCILNLRYDD